jgi:hypothetical protein
MFDFLIGLYLLVVVVLLLITYSSQIVMSTNPERWIIWLKLCASWPSVFWSVAARERWKVILGIK